MRELRPELAIIDVRMPPTQTDEGARAAVELRAEQPELAVLLLSQDVETRVALTLMEEQPRGFGTCSRTVSSPSTSSSTPSSASAGAARRSIPRSSCG